MVVYTAQLGELHMVVHIATCDTAGARNTIPASGLGRRLLRNHADLLPETALIPARHAHARLSGL